MNDITIYALVAFVGLVTTIASVHALTGFHP
jgi:hypothetical protein